MSSLNESSPGRKDDSGKLRFDLIPGYPLSLLADVYTRGANKYADRNWEKGIQWSRIFAALMRHAWKWFCGQRYDEIDGQHHLASVAWCAFALMEYEQTHPELDDRPRHATLGIELAKRVEATDEMSFQNLKDSSISR